MGKTSEKGYGFIEANIEEIIRQIKDSNTDEIEKDNIIKILRYGAPNTGGKDPQKTADEMKSFDFVKSHKRWNKDLGMDIQVKGYLRCSKWLKEKIKQAAQRGEIPNGCFGIHI